VKLFDKTYGAGMDYFFAVLAREDVVGQLKDVETPRDLMAFIGRVELGDQWGILKPNRNGAVFVHPGLKTPTRFDLDLTALAKVSGQHGVEVVLEMSSEVPQNAVERGAANVIVTLMSGSQTLAEPTITVGHPFRLDVSVAQHPQLTVIVDNNGASDTDWLIFSIW